MKLKIQRLEWEIDFDDSGELEACGETYYTDLKILIARTDNKSLLRSTIMHELTHAVRWTYGHMNSVEVAGIPQEIVEEEIANTVEAYCEEIIELTNKVMKGLK